MFTRSQRFYDAIYSWKDYAEEAAQIKRLISEYKRSPDNTLLDVACGTGGHIPYLSSDFAYEGLDLDPEMLALAKQRFPDVVFHQGDMANFNLGRQFDVVTCLFSSIAYTRTVPRLQQAIGTLAGHVCPGGVLLIGAFFPPQDWNPGHPYALFVDQPDLKIARMNVSSVEGDVAILDFHYLVATTEGVEHFTEHHELGLFTDDEYRGAFQQAGMDVTRDADWLIGRGLYIGTHALAGSSSSSPSEDLFPSGDTDSGRSGH
jgi:SAM-dependent methyltransferase